MVVFWSTYIHVLRLQIASGISKVDNSNIGYLVLKNRLGIFLLFTLRLERYHLLLG